MPRRYLFRLLSAVPPGGDHVPDTELLRRYCATKDAAAFELLVRRHADAVWAACGRILRHDADAEDAFQAAFVVLARKAAEVRGPCVGGWLHRVAVNAALKLRASRERERPELTDLRSLTLPARQAPGSPEDATERTELAAIVHQELVRLPDRYRLPVVLCDLEGHTHAEAARVLNWPVGSVSGRLSRARGILRDRLARRGVTAPAAIAGVLSAGPPPASAVSAASAIAAGTVSLSPAVSALTEGVLSAMRTAKLKLTAALAAGLLGLAGAGTVIGLTQPGSQPPKIEAPPPGVLTADPPVEGDWTPKGGFDPVPTAFPDLKPPVVPKDPRGKAVIDFDRKAYEQEFAKLCPRVLGDIAVTIEPNDDTYRRLLKARLHQGKLELRRVQEVIAVGKWISGEYIQSVQLQNDMRAVVSELYANDPKTLIPWLEEFVMVAKQWERFAGARVETGIDPPQALNAARRHRLEVEAALWKAKNGPRPGGGGGPGR